MESWDLHELETPAGSRSPVVLFSGHGEARAVLIALDPGQELGEHQVKERAFVVVVDGTARIESGGERIEGGPGTMATFAPNERHIVASAGGARILLLLAPWPGEGHFRGEEREVERP